MNVEVGQRLVAGTTGHEYVVRDVDDDTTLVSGPYGPLIVQTDELKQEIADGNVGLQEWR